MSYIGNTSTTQAFTPAVDFFNGNGSTTAFTLSRPVASVAQVQAVISNVPQNPGTAYTVSGNTITFTSAPPSGTQNIYVYYTSPITQVIAPGQGTVGTTVLVDGSVTPAKLSTGGPSWDTSGNVTLTGNITLNNGTADGAQLTLASSGYSDWNIDNYSGKFRWYYNATEYMRLDSGWGALLVGNTTAPSSNNIRLSIAGRSGGNNGGLQLLTDGGGGGALFSNNGAGLQFYSFTGAAGSESYTERARIDSSGNLLVGTTSNGTISGLTPRARFSVADSGYWAGAFQNATSSGAAYGVVVSYPSVSPNNNGSEFIYCQDSTALRFGVRSNGGVANFSGNNVNLSDRREKTNFAPAGDYLSKICAIPVQTFNYIDQNLEEDAGLTLGVIAQDVQAVAPELVMESNWGTQEEPKMRLSIYQTDLQYALMKCIQEQQAIIETLTNRITALENK